MEYIIKPYKSVTVYKFGCLLEDLLSKIKSNFKRVDNNGLTKLYLDNLSLVFKDNKLVEISVIENKDVELYYDEYELFSYSNIIDKLNESHSCIHKYGFTIFDSIGVAFSGFQEDEGDRTVTVYSPHYWDEIVN